jgi:NADH-quinone oxidoreductase subunit J
MIDVIVFVVAAVIVLGGGVGVVLNRNPVRAALSLIATFFGVAVLFMLQQAHFLALVQIIVYAGAIVVLFLFVIMLLGVDRTEDLSVDPLAGQRWAGVVVGVVVLALVLGGLFLSGPGGDESAIALTGQRGGVETLKAEAAVAAGEPIISSGAEAEASDINQLSEDLFTRNVLAFEATALLLTIATVGAVVLVRNQGAEDLVVDEPGRATK